MRYPLKGRLVKEVQKAIGTNPDGFWGAKTEDAMQRTVEKNRLLAGTLLAIVYRSAYPNAAPAAATVADRRKSRQGGKENPEFPHYDIPWLKVADSLDGVTEVPGKGNNPLIVEMAQETGSKWIKSDSTAWCSTAMCYTFMMAGYPHTASAMAKSWETYGVAATLGVGCLAVFDRSQPGNPKTAWWRHVGLIRKIYSEEKIALQGGNQSDAYCTKTYSTDKLKAIRLPEGWRVVNGVARPVDEPTEDEIKWD